jgi:signal transduction histidine kinase
MRDDFMSVVSHEVRTPLNGLILETQLRKMHVAKGNAEAFTLDKMRGMVERDERQIQSLIRLIEDMLDVARIRTGKLSIRPARFDLAQLVSNVVDRFAHQAAQVGVVIDYTGSAPVIGDWDEFRIEQVVVNLLTNALRYGGKGIVEVSVGVEDGMAQVGVRDHGAGISPEDQQRIFMQFERASNRHGIAGLGLGLFISEQIISAHNGRITVQSTPGEGALFSIHLPLVACPG